LVANADLKKEHEIAKAYRLKKIQDISSDDYAKMESAYIAIFVSEMKQQSIDIKESLGKTTLDERLADYKKSQREEINRVYEDAYANPMDTEEIRANGKLVLPYKTIFLKAKNEYLIISL
jgi:transposase